MNRPSRKSVYIAVPVAIILVVFALLIKDSQKNAVQSENTSLSVQNILNEEDSDGDGLKDWEELLWNLDPNKAESNPDGINDNEYVKNRVSDIKENPEEMNKPGTFSFNTGTKTGDLGRELFSEYISLKEGGSLTPFSINQVVERVQKKYTPQISPDQISISDIKTVADSATAFSSYSNQVVSIRSKYLGLYGQNPVENSDISESEGSKESFKEKILFASELYNLMAQDLMQVPTPKSLAEQHAALISSYLISSEGLSEFSKMHSDPLLALFGVQKHSEAVDLETTALTNIQSILSSNGIIFNNSL